MALILKHEVHVGDNCRTLYFSDTTGLYSAGNLGGWNNVGGTDPNILISAVTETHIIITLPDGTTVVDILDPTGLPSSSSIFEYEIPVSGITTGAVIADGLYQIEYTVTDGITEYTSGKKYFLFTCNVECCSAQLFAKIATASDCSCDSTIIKNALYVGALVEGLLANKDCGNIININKLLTKLNTICNSTSSNCGCS